MAEPYIGEIRMFGGNFAPLHWAFCYGQLLTINDYPALFSLIGTRPRRSGMPKLVRPSPP